MAIVTSTVKALITCDDQQDHSQMKMSVYNQNQSQTYQLETEIIKTQVYNGVKRKRTLIYHWQMLYNIWETKLNSTKHW